MLGHCSTSHCFNSLLQMTFRRTNDEGPTASETVFHSQTDRRVALKKQIMTLTRVIAQNRQSDTSPLNCDVKALRRSGFALVFLPHRLCCLYVSYDKATEQQNLCKLHMCSFIFSTKHRPVRYKSSLRLFLPIWV